MTSFQEDGIQVYFVYKNEPLETTVSDIMNSAYTYLQDYIDQEQITWILESNACDLVDQQCLNRKDIFILEEFQGEIFKKLQTTKALIIGPRCLLSCILDDKPIPLGTSPVFITSMRDMSVCISGLKDSEKQNLRNLISFMGGCYIKDLRKMENLYLVSNTIKSTKYEQATLNSIPVMLPEWVNAVWMKGKAETICATDAYFDQYKLPIFYAVNITTSGLTGEVRDKIMKLVQDNGGNFQRTFKSNQTDILITIRECSDSDKFKAAVKYKKDVLIPDWIFDSVLKGYALPITNYRVNSIKVSTPTKNDHSIPDFTGNFTQLSEISTIDGHGSNLPENDVSICSNASTLSGVVNKCKEPKINYAKTSSNANKMYKKILLEINTQQAKKAGNFLDGCSIFLSGFNDEEKEKLNKILGVSGAHHYSEINEKITHVIVGEIIEKDFNEMHNRGIGASIVTLNWIVDSIKLKQPILDDVQYRPKLPIRNEPEAPSPRSKKSLQSLNHSFKKPEIPKKNLFSTISKDQMPTNDEAEVNGLLSHYSQENNLSAGNIPLDIPVAPKKINNLHNQSLAKEKNQNDDDLLKNVNGHKMDSYQDSNREDMSNINFFDGLKIYVDKFHHQELYTQIVYDCEQALGQIVSDKYIDVVDYAIVSYEEAVDVKKLPVRAKYIVNGLWMDDAITANELISIEYFHMPIPITANKQPLTDMTIVVSVYSGSERCFLEQLIIVLGANYKETYVKKDKALLVVPAPEGMKYKAALKWGYPAVSSNWLVKCAETGNKVDLTSYLIGETQVGDITIFKQKSSGDSSFSNNDSIPNSTPTTSKIKKLKMTEEYGEAEKSPITRSETDVTPLRHRRVFQLAGGARSESTPTDQKSPNVDNMPITPPSPYVDMFEDLDGYLRDRIQDEEVRECCKQMLLEAKNTKTPELERLKKLIRTPGDISSPASYTVPDFCRTPEFRKRMFEFVEKRWHLSVEKRKPDTPLSEIKRKLWKETFPAEFLAEINYCVDSPEPSTSSDGSNEKEFKLEGQRNKNFKRTSSGSNVAKAFFDSNTPKSSNKEFDDASPGVKRLKDFIKNCEEERNNSARKSNVSKILPITNQMNEEESQAVGVPQRYETEMFNSERMVGWGDNIDFVLGKKSRSDNMQFKGIPIFNISTTAEFDKNPVLQDIKKLRGEICENITTYDAKSTHIVCERPNRGEKLLSSVAAGKWILSINYISDSTKQGYFLNEELYEWGNPKAVNLPTLKPAEQAIANAFYFWRNKISADSNIKGAFNGFSVVLHLPERSRNSFANVITAGNGIVINDKPPYDKSIISQATHCLIDPKKLALEKIDHDLFSTLNIPIISIMFISSYLTNDPNVDITEFILSM